MANANPVVEAAAATVATNTLPATPAPVEIVPEAQAFSPDAEAAMEARGSGTSSMPREWLDSTKVIKQTATHADTFGAIPAGDDKGYPAEELLAGQAGTITTEDEATEDGATETTDGEGETEAGETTETAEEPAKVEAKKDDKAPAEKTEVLKQTRAIRRTALDAMRIEGEKRHLEGRLRDERKAREAALSDRAAFEAKLKTAPMEERLRMIGVRDKDALLEMQLRGEIPDFKEPEAPAKVEPAKPVEDPEKAAMSKRIADLEARDRDREMQAANSRAAATAAQAAATVKGILSAPEVAAEVKFTLASGNEAIADVMARAEQLWVASGSKAGDERRHVISAAREAEAILAERYAPILAAAGVTASNGEPKAKQPGPVIPGTPPKAKVAVAGKKLASRGSTLEDDLPLDPMMRDAIIKRERGWGGSQ